MPRTIRVDWLIEHPFLNARFPPEADAPLAHYKNEPANWFSLAIRHKTLSVLRWGSEA